MAKLHKRPSLMMMMERALILHDSAKKVVANGIHCARRCDAMRACPNDDALFALLISHGELQ